MDVTPSVSSSQEHGLKHAAGPGLRMVDSTYKDQEIVSEKDSVRSAAPQKDGSGDVTIHLPEKPEHDGDGPVRQFEDAAKETAKADSKAGWRAYMVLWHPQLSQE